MSGGLSLDDTLNHLVSELQKLLVEYRQTVMRILDQLVRLVNTAEHALESQIFIASIFESLENGVSLTDQLDQSASVLLNPENIVFLTHIVLL